MKTNLVRAALACAALMLSSNAAFASCATGAHIRAGNGPVHCPIPSVEVVVKKNGVIVSRAQTSENGSLKFDGLPPGDYELAIDGKTLVAALDDIVPPPAPPPKQSGGGASLSVGGLFGGGGSHSDHDGHGSHGGGGGVGLGVSIPLGGDPDPKASGTPFYGPDGNVVIVAELSIGGTNTVSLKTPYCRGSAGPGIRIGFTISEEASAGNLAAPVGVTLSIADQGSTNNLSSY